MGGAFYRALAQEFAEDELYVCDHNQEKLNALNALHITADANELIESVGTVILAIKPQSFDQFVSALSASLADKLVISIMAGVSVAKIQQAAGSGRVVRSMPNLGVELGKGVTGWFAGAEVTNKDKQFAEKIFLAGGESIEVKDEKMIDAVAALSGSGPAYFFYLTELLQKKAEELGFAPAAAKKIAEATFIGAAGLFEKGNKSAGEWREAVSSKGGSTVEAIKYLRENKFDEIFWEAIERARRRWE